ncbi:MAG: hypothetical protein RG741_10255, partial [Bacteroidales bacterium]|nr:hypothetical protein [Bacteroidales bacterium]
MIISINNHIMKKILVFIASVLVATATLAQGVTKHGESTTTGHEFVDEHGNLVGEPALDKHGRILSAGLPNGNGTQNNPYQVANLANLTWITEQSEAGNTFAGQYFIQTADIDASPTQTWFNGYGWTPIGTMDVPFSGIYNGNSYSISSLFINRPDQNNIGLFGVVSDGVLTNISLIYAEITGYNSVGSLAGRITDLTDVSYSNSLNHQVILHHQIGGGLVGRAISSTLYRCNTSGELQKVNTSDWNHIGGLVGLISSSSLVDECFSHANVNSLMHNVYGGLVGRAETSSEILNSYARGSVIGTWAIAGGLTGDLSAAGIINSYSTGEVYGDHLIGGLVGRLLNNGTCSNCFWDITTSNQNSSACGIGRTTAQMKSQDTFTNAGWDFENVWGLDPYINDGYPFLRWEYEHLYMLSLDVSPENTGSVTGAGEYLEGAEASITATANPGWEFVNWTGDITYVADPNAAGTTVTMPAQNVSLTANFLEEVEPVFFNLSLGVHPENTGSVTGAGAYQEGAEASITATANPGWEFVNWTGDITYVADP